MQRVEGKTIARKILRDGPFAARGRSWRGSRPQVIAGIHGLPAENCLICARSSATKEVADLDAGLAASLAAAVFELALRWLRERESRP